MYLKMSSAKRWLILSRHLCVNTLRPRQNGRNFADDMFESIFLNENVWIPIEISLTFVPKVPIDNIAALVQIIAWRRPGARPLSEPMMDSLLTHICVTRPQCVKAAYWPTRGVLWSQQNNVVIILRWIEFNCAEIPHEPRMIFEYIRIFHTSWQSIPCLITIKQRPNRKYNKLGF